jgi:transaldolase
VGIYEESQQLFSQLERLGIDYDDVVQYLEDSGVTTFDNAWQQLGDQLAATLRAQSARQQRS